MLSSPVLPPEMIRTKWEKALNRFFICIPSNPLLVSEECKEQKKIKRTQTSTSRSITLAPVSEPATLTPSHTLRVFPNTFISRLPHLTPVLHNLHAFKQGLSRDSNNCKFWLYWQNINGYEWGRESGTESLLSGPESISGWKAKHHQMAGKSRGQGAPIMLRKTQERYRENTVSSMHRSVHSNNGLQHDSKGFPYLLNHLVDDQANIKANSLST